MTKLLNRRTILLICAAVAIGSPAFGEEGEHAAGHERTAAHAVGCYECAGQRGSLTDNWFTFGDKLEEHGVKVTLAATQVYQLNLEGGLATHRHAGRYEGSYDLITEFDAEKLLGIPGGSIYSRAEGSWSDGLDPSSVGSLFNVNGDAAGDNPIELTQLYWEQALFGERLRFRLGKVDLTGTFECRGCPASFDGNAFANDETAQFLNGALVNNPTIPFPEPGLAATVFAKPVDWWYVAAAGDAKADAGETGFNTAFHDEPFFFSIYETGFVPIIPSPMGGLRGAYRVGMWLDPRHKERFEGEGTKHNDVGMYVSADQVLLREDPEKDDHQGLGVFGRYGFAPRDVNPINNFWSVGAQYQGLIPTRDNDVLAFGVAQGLLTKEAGFTASHETAMEAYYNISVIGWFNLTPSVQYIFNPGGGDVDRAVVVGIRAQMNF
jgi:carbohydrate-selective porin OprB